MQYGLKITALHLNILLLAQTLHSLAVKNYQAILYNPTALRVTKIPQIIDIFFKIKNLGNLGILGILGNIEKISTLWMFSTNLARYHDAFFIWTVKTDQIHTR